MEKTYRAYLKSREQSATKPRLALLAYLSESHQATTEQIISALADIADPASIYRSIKMLSQAGAITSRSYGGKVVHELSDALGTHHHHMQCTNCHETQNFLDPTLEKNINEAARRNGFSDPSHQIEISGTCLKCNRP